MTKIPILTIGYFRFALPAKSNIAVILQSLSASEAVDYTYEGTEKVYFPETGRHRSEIAIEYIDAKQLRAEAPRRPKDDADDAVVVTPRRALMPAQLTLEGGRHAS